MLASFQEMLCHSEARWLSEAESISDRVHVVPGVTKEAYIDFYLFQQRRAPHYTVLLVYLFEITTNFSITMPSKQSYLVTLATGRQGTSTAAELRKHDNIVHVFVRDKTSERAKHLESLGCIVFEGSADDIHTIEPAMRGVTGIFLNFFPDFQDLTSQARQAQNYLTVAAASKTVTSVVVSTALHADKHTQWLADDPNYPMKAYYGAKVAIEEVVRASDIKYKTILRPGWLMHNYLEPLWRTHYPRYQSEHVLDVAYPPGSKTAHFDAADMGKLAAAAFLDPERFDNEVIECGNEQLTIEDVAREIGGAIGVKMKSKYLTLEEVDEFARQAPGLRVRLWGTKEGAFTNDPKPLEKYGVQLTTLKKFVQREKELKDIILRQN